MVVLLAIGMASSISGAVGILRLPDTYLRIQASSKTVTMGALPVLVAVVVAKGFDSVYAARALIVAVLLLVMNPLATHALARAAYKAGVPMWTGAVTDQARPAARDVEQD
ncbi:MAG TPA: monovalent cation/H(+) antiporter subunit G [Micromonosporaceae bacterium]